MPAATSSSLLLSLPFLKHRNTCARTPQAARTQHTTCRHARTQSDTHAHSRMRLGDSSSGLGDCRFWMAAARSRAASRCPKLMARPGVTAAPSPSSPPNIDMLCSWRMASSQSQNRPSPSARAARLTGSREQAWAQPVCRVVPPVATRALTHLRLGARAPLNFGPWPCVGAVAEWEPCQA